MVELGLAPDMFLTLQDYANADRFVAPSPQRYSELSLGANTCGDPFFLAAQGVGMYFASGDAPGVETPDDPFTILVGGTSLGIGKHGQRLFETGWPTGLSVIKHGTWFLTGQGGATSGGPSLIWAQPPYQRGVVPRALAKARDRASGHRGRG